MKFPPLYKKTQSGDPQGWVISVEGSTIKTDWGRVGGKIQHGADTILEGKSVGRANETTPQQQAESEAKSQWEFKKKHGYVEDQEQAMAGKVDKVIEGGIFPMKAHKYHDHSKRITFPAYAQPKLDGHRCIGILKDGKVTLWSSSRMPINSVPHIVAALEAGAVASKITTDFIFDGELYNHEYHDNFEELTHFIRQTKPILGHEVVQYHIYDLPMNSDYDNRLSALLSFSGQHPDPGPLKFVETVAVASDKELTLQYERFMDQGYEGAMVRNIKGPYEANRRSYNLLKVKEMIDEEFEIVGVEEGRGKLKGHGIFVCKINPNLPITGENTFTVKMKGPTNNLKQYWNNPTSVISKQLTVQFQGWTKYGKPRFPVGLRFRVDI